MQIGFINIAQSQLPCAASCKANARPMPEPAPVADGFLKIFMRPPLNTVLGQLMIVFAGLNGPMPPQSLSNGRIVLTKDSLFLGFG